MNCMLFGRHRRLRLRRNTQESARSLGIEELEDRIVLATTEWIGGGNQWHLPTNWDNGVPTANDTTLIQSNHDIALVTGNGFTGRMIVNSEQVTLDANGNSLTSDEWTLGRDADAGLSIDGGEFSSAKTTIVGQGGHYGVLNIGADAVFSTVGMHIARDVTYRSAMRDTHLSCQTE